MAKYVALPFSTPPEIVCGRVGVSDETDEFSTGGDLFAGVVFGGGVGFSV